MALKRVSKEEAEEMLKSQKGTIAQTAKDAVGEEYLATVYTDPFDGWDHIINIFIDTESFKNIYFAVQHDQITDVLRKRTGKSFNTSGEDNKGFQITINVIDAPEINILRNDGFSIEIDYFIRTTDGSFNCPRSTRKWSLDEMRHLDTDPSALKTFLEEDQEAAIDFLTTRTLWALVNYLINTGVVDSLRELKKYAKAGIVVLAKSEDSIHAEIVQDETRPDLECQLITGEAITARPYLDEKYPGMVFVGNESPSKSEEKEQKVTQAADREKGSKKKTLTKGIQTPQKQHPAEKVTVKSAEEREKNRKRYDKLEKNIKYENDKLRNNSLELKKLNRQISNIELSAEQAEKAVNEEKLQINDILCNINDEYSHKIDNKNQLINGLKEKETSLLKEIAQISEELVSLSVLRFGRKKELKKQLQTLNLTVNENREKIDQYTADIEKLSETKDEKIHGELEKLEQQKNTAVQYRSDRDIAKVKRDKIEKSISASQDNLRRMRPEFEKLEKQLAYGFHNKDDEQTSISKEPINITQIDHEIPLTSIEKRILGILSERGDSMTATEIAKTTGMLSPQKTSSILRHLEEKRKVKRGKEGGRTVYTAINITDTNQKKHGLSREEKLILEILSRGDSMTPTEVSIAAEISSPQKACAILHQLEKEGKVKRGQEGGRTVYTAINITDTNQKKHGLSREEKLILEILSRGDSMTPTEVSIAAEISSPQKACAILHQLEKEGKVKRGTEGRVTVFSLM